MLPRSPGGKNSHPSASRHGSQLVRHSRGAGQRETACAEHGPAQVSQAPSDIVFLRWTACSAMPFLRCMVTGGPRAAGYFDSGDSFVKYSYPIATTVGMLAWSLAQFPGVRRTPLPVAPGRLSRPHMRSGSAPCWSSPTPCGAMYTCLGWLPWALTHTDCSVCEGPSIRMHPPRPACQPELTRFRRHTHAARGMHARTATSTHSLLVADSSCQAHTQRHCRVVLQSGIRGGSCSVVNGCLSSVC